MTEEIVVTESIRLGTLEIAPTGVIARATQIATELAALINNRKLYVPISGKKYVRVEGWTTLGAMLGVTPREVSTITHEDGTFEATVEIVRSDGTVVGRGSAICGMDEPTWAKRPAYARRSMAITRATGKAFRLAYSWIMTLAGYEATPAEEIIDAEPLDSVDKTFPPKAASSTPPVADPTKNINHLDGNLIKFLVAQGVFENDHSAAKIMARILSDKAPFTAFTTKAQNYRAWKTRLVDGGIEKEEATILAIEKANAGEGCTPEENLSGMKA